MFTLRTYDQIAAAMARGDLVETATLDGKAFPTVANGNVEIAKDIAAMATGGGVIIYGIGEDADKRLTVDRAFELAGHAERITNIVATNLSDPPKIVITRIEKPEQPTHGYLVVEVPQSSRAPHMVQVQGENRYYGRDSTGNRPLTAVDVERLYRLRAEWERGIDELLDHGSTRPWRVPLCRRRCGALGETRGRGHAVVTKHVRPGPYSILRNPTAKPRLCRSDTQRLPRSFATVRRLQYSQFYAEPSEVGA